MEMRVRREVPWDPPYAYEIMIRCLVLMILHGTGEEVKCCILGFLLPPSLERVSLG